ncbi:hypothetical protein KGY71_05000 [Candidatus Bipolaricaulota bacterium]|nr:hypothetical protein [Candidatus Bipolaricaulota bacterium]
MTKKFVALTMVLVLVAGVGALAATEDRPLTGYWNSTLTLDPTATPVISGFSSTLYAEYVSGGITYSSTSTFTEAGFTDQLFGVNTSMGLLTLDSTVDFDPTVPALSYWTTDASLGLGGVNLSTLFLLQDTGSQHYGAGLKFSLSGETPGGVSVAVDNYFGMDSSTATDSGYVIVTDHDETQTDSYGASSLQYVSTVLTLDSMSLGCCDFSSTTKFSEANGFEYTKFSFTLSSTNLPISLAGTLKFEEQTKSIVLTPSIDTHWGCFEVYTDLSGTLANNGVKGDTIDALQIKGFALVDVPLGHVNLSSYTALGSNTLYSISAPGTYSTSSTGYDELIRIKKLDEFTLGFTVDTYFDMTESSSLFDLALFHGQASYALSDQFTFGSGLVVKPSSGLDKISFSLDYSW